MRVFRSWVVKFIGFNVLILSLFACSTPSLTQPKPVTEVTNPEKLSIWWSISLSVARNAGSFMPVVEGDAVFTADSSGTIFKIDITDGTIIQKIKLNQKLSSGIAVSSDSIFVTTLSGYLLSINKATGQIRWQKSLPTLSIEAPQVFADFIVVKTNDSALLAYRVDTGNLLWIYQTTTPVLTLRAYNTFKIIPPDVLIVGEPGGKLALINLLNGNPIWEDLVSSPTGATDLDKLTDIVSKPALKDKEICVVSYNGKLECIDAVSNNVLWEKSFSSDKSLLLDEQNLYAINLDGIIYAFDRSTGVVVWENDDLQYHILGDPVFLGNNLLIIENDGHINLIARGNGKLTARIESDLKNGIATPWSDGEKIIVQSGNGNITRVTQ